MFYQEHEKKIYSPEGSDKSYDPLALHRSLVTETGGKFDELWVDWTCVSSDSGDVSEPQSQKELASALAEGELVRAARKAFKLPEFPDCLDAVVLEYLRDFVEWLEGKGQRAATTQSWPEHSQVA